jgi:DNA-binding response OmpR family regulator
VVLVVEDDSGVTVLLTDILAGAGYAPTTAGSVLGAVALTRRLRPAVVLLDLGLPSRSGGALLADPALAAVPVLVGIPIAAEQFPSLRVRIWL